MGRQFEESFGMGISHMISVSRMFRNEIFYNMNLLRLIPILVVVTSQLNDYDPFSECP